MTRFRLEGEPLVIDLLNTRVREQGGFVELLNEPGALTEWVERHPERLPELQGGRFTVANELQQVREATRRLLDATRSGRPRDDSDVAVLNDAAAAAPTYLQLVLDDEDGLGAQRRGAASMDDDLLARVGEAAIEFLVSPTVHRVRECAGPGCILLFLASHPARRWCSSATCGNRVRVARHYHQQRKGPRSG